MKGGMALGIIFLVSPISGEAIGQLTSTLLLKGNIEGTNHWAIQCRAREGKHKGRRQSVTVLILLRMSTQLLHEISTVAKEKPPVRLRILRNVKKRGCCRAENGYKVKVPGVG